MKYFFLTQSAISTPILANGIFGVLCCIIGSLTLLIEKR